MIIRTGLICLLFTITLPVRADGVGSVSPRPYQQTPSPNEQQSQESGKPSRQKKGTQGEQVQQTQQTEKSSGQKRAVPPRKAMTLSDRNLVRSRVANLRKTRDLLSKQARAPIPADLSPTDRAEVQRHQRWLKQSARQLDKLARNGDKLMRMEGSMGAQQEMQEMNRSFSMQYLSLQNKLQQESREYNLVSNIMKQRHEAAKNAINNIR